MVAMVAFTASCVGILLFLWLAFGGSVPLKPESYRVTVVVPEAATLVEEADVRLAGVNIGKVKKRSLDKGAARTRVEVEIKARYAPIPRDSKVILRQKTLLGEAFLEFTPGNPKTGQLEDGSQLNTKNVESTTELDEIFRIFDPPTRRAFREWVQEGSTVVAGDYPQNFNDALGNLAPFATDGSKLLQILDDQEIAVRGTIKHTGRVFNALAAEEGQLLGPDHERQRDLRGAGLARRVAVADLRGAAHLPARDPHHAAPARSLRRQHPAAGQRPQGPGRRPRRPRFATSANLAPDLTQTFKDLNPLIRASRTRPAGRHPHAARRQPAGGRHPHADPRAQPRARRPQLQRPVGRALPHRGRRRPGARTAATATPTTSGSTSTGCPRSRRSTVRASASSPAGRPTTAATPTSRPTPTARAEPR